MAENSGPRLFYDPSNLQGACKPCNYSGGREIQLGNRADRQPLNHHERVIDQQEAELDELGRRLEEYEWPRPRPMAGQPLTIS